MDQHDSADMTDPTLPSEPTESTDASEPAEPIDRIEPADPIERIEPVEPMDKMEPLEPMLRMEPAWTVGWRIGAFWPPGVRERSQPHPFRRTKARCQELLGQHRPGGRRRSRPSVPAGC